LRVGTPETKTGGDEFRSGHDDALGGDGLQLAVVNESDVDRGPLRLDRDDGRVASMRSECFALRVRKSWPASAHCRRAASGARRVRRSLLASPRNDEGCGVLRFRAPVRRAVGVPPLRHFGRVIFQNVGDWKTVKVRGVFVSIESEHGNLNCLKLSRTVLNRAGDECRHARYRNPFAVDDGGIGAVDRQQRKADSLASR